MRDSKYPVCIVGVGARTAAGLNAVSSAAAVRAAISAIEAHPYMVDKVGEPMDVAMVPVPEEGLRGGERFAVLAAPALQEALAPLATLGTRQTPVPLVLGLPEARPGRPPTLDQDLPPALNRLGLTAPPLGRITTMPYGHAAGLMALGVGWQQIQQGHVEFCLAGSVDSYMMPETLEWLDGEKQLMSAENPSGFPPGEAAGFCLMTSTRLARRLGLKILAYVVAVATTLEKNRIKTKTICIGEGLTAAIAQVITALNLPQEKIDFTICDMNGERYRTEEFVFTILRTQAAFVDANNFMTPADCWGDVGAASGPLFASLVVAAGLRGYAEGQRALLWTSSEGGQRSAAILHL